MDVKMPRMDGIEATRSIKRAHPKTIVVLLSAYNDETLIAEAREAGADRYLVKGASPRAVLQTVRDAVGSVVAPLA